MLSYRLHQSGGSASAAPNAWGIGEHCGQPALDAEIGFIAGPKLAPAQVPVIGGRLHLLRVIMPCNDV